MSLMELTQGTRTIIDNTDTGIEVVPIMTRYEGVMDCYSTVLSEEGWAGLYKGFGALVLQYGLHIAILKLTRSVFEFFNNDVDKYGSIDGRGGYSDVNFNQGAYNDRLNSSHLPNDQAFGFSNSPLQRYDASLNRPTRDHSPGNFRDRFNRSNKP